MHPWNCLISRVSLSPLSTTPVTEDYATAYQVPPDCARVLSVNSSAQWRVEGRTILSDESSALIIRYVKVIADPAQWDVRLREIVSSALAVEISDTLSQSASKKQLLIEELRLNMSRAARTDAQEGSTPHMVEDDWVTSRNAGSGFEDWAV